MSDKIAPKGWEVNTLNQISENLDNRRVPITKKIRSNGSIPYYGASGIVDYVEEYIFDEDLLLISEDGANLLARTYPIAFSINGKTWVNNHAHVLRFKDKTSQRFVEFYLNSIKLDDFVSGMAQPKLNQTMLNKIPIPFPTISKQKYIVDILDEAFESITKAKENAEKNLKNAKEIFESYLQTVFENKGEGWEAKTLMEVSDQITDGSHFSPNSSTEDEYPYITVKDIEDDIIDFENCKFISNENYQALLKNGCKPNLGDLLFSKDGTVGKVSLVEFEKDFVVLSSLAIIRPNRKIIDSSLLKYILKNPSFLKIAIGKKTGVAIRRIILKNLKIIEICYPKSITEQQSIASKLDTLSQETKKLEAIYQKKLADLEELKKSILAKAFKGELTEASA